MIAKIYAIDNENNRFDVTDKGVLWLRIHMYKYAYQFVVEENEEIELPQSRLDMIEWYRIK